MDTQQGAVLQGVQECLQPAKHSADRLIRQPVQFSKAQVCKRGPTLGGRHMAAQQLCNGVHDKSVPAATSILVNVTGVLAMRCVGVLTVTYKVVEDCQAERTSAGLSLGRNVYAAEVVYEFAHSPVTLLQYEGTEKRVAPSAIRGTLVGCVPAWASW